MSKAIITEQHLHDIANAIIAKGGATDPMTPAQMPDAIRAIPSGGSEERPSWDPTWTATTVKIAVPKEGLDVSIAVSPQCTALIDWGDGTEESQYNSSYNILLHVPHHYVSSLEDRIVTAVIGGNSKYISSAIYRTYTYSVYETLGFAFMSHVVDVLTVSPYLNGNSTGGNESVFNRITRKVKTFALPPNCTSLRYFLYGCSGLTGSIPEIPSGVTTMAFAFSGCSGLTGSIPEIPSGVTTMEEAFRGCSGLTEITKSPPDSCTNMNSAFTGCISIQRLPDDWHANGVTSANNWSNGGADNNTWASLVALPTRPTFNFSTSFLYSINLSKESVATFDGSGNIIGGFVYGINTCLNSGQTITLSSTTKALFTADEQIAIGEMMTAKNWTLVW